MAEEQNRTLQDKFMLRLPDGMRERIKAVALGRGRSMNTEIVLLIDQSLSFIEALDGAPPAGDGKLSLLVRLPSDLGSRVKTAAEENSRTVNAEIVATLEEKYPEPTISDELFQASVFQATFLPQGSIAGAHRKTKDPNLQSKFAHLLEKFLLLQMDVVGQGEVNVSRRPELLRLLGQGAEAAMKDLRVIEAGGEPEHLERVRLEQDS